MDAPADSGWIATLAAMGGVVTIVTTGINAYFNRAVRLAILERVDSAKTEIVEQVEGKIERLRDEVVRKDVIDEWRKRVDASLVLLEQERREAMRSRMRRLEDHGDDA